MCENRAGHEPKIHDEGLRTASALVKSGSICFYPSMESDGFLPYIVVDEKKAAETLSLSPDHIAGGLPIRMDTLDEASTLAVHIVEQITHIPIAIRHIVQSQTPAHEYLPDGTISLGSRVESDADILQQLFGSDSKQRRQVEVCAVALGIGHELGHGIAQQAKNIELPNDPIVDEYTKWFMFSGAYSSSQMAEEQFATGMGYLVTAIAAQNYNLVPNWTGTVNKFFSDDRQILAQFIDLMKLLKSRNGNPFSLSLGLARLQAGLRKSHPELAQKVPQLSPYYIGYYTAVNPVTIMQYFQN